MSDLSNITHQEIENKILIILNAYENKILDQYLLWNKIIDRFELKNKYISPIFKNKFLIVLRNLKNRYDDIEVITENNIYKAVSKKDPLNDFINEYEEIKQNYECEENLEDKNLFDKNELNNYILDNNLYEELDYEDSNGNTIFHDLVSGNNYYQINKLINENKFNFTKINKLNKSPIDLINSLDVTNIILKDALNKINKLENKVFLLENKNIDIIEKINELSLSQFLKIKIINFIKNYKFKITLILSVMSVYLFYRLFNY